MPLSAPPSARNTIVRIEHGDQPFEIALASGRGERIDDTPLLLQVVCVRDAPLNALPHYLRVDGGDSGLVVPAASAAGTWAPGLDRPARSERGRMFWL
jgi:hypothetical protein